MRCLNLVDLFLWLSLRDWDSGNSWCPSWKKRAFGSPDWTQLHFRGIDNPHEQESLVGNDVMETAGSLRSRRYKCLHLDALFERNFKKDSEFLWTVGHRPRLANESHLKNCHHDHYLVWFDEEKIARMHQMNPWCLRAEC